MGFRQDSDLLVCTKTVQMFCNRMLRGSFRPIRSLHTDIAFAFDIDGVLLRSKTPIPGASEALKLLQQHNVPFILLTNGGGTLESQRTDFISKALDVSLSPLQIVQSHTPYKTLTPKYEKVLAVGIPSVREVAERYGFKDVVHSADIVKYNRDITPFSAVTDARLQELSKNIKGLDSKPFDAVLVFNDPRDWAADIQIIADLLNSDGGMLNTLRKERSSKPSIPIYFSNNDLLWANHYKLNRFGQGAFRIIVETLYSHLNDGLALDSFVLGKPTRITYDFAHHVLIDWRKKLLEGNTTSTSQVLPTLGVAPEKTPFKKVFMVGDNPASDIIGAYKYGWSSCLVKTGVYKDGDTLPCKPTMIVDNVLEAVQQGLDSV